MSIKSLILVLVQFACLIGLAWRATVFPSIGYGIPGVLSLLFILWSILEAGVYNINVQPEAKKNTVLITKGPYKYVRHPIYTGIMIYALFICLESYEALDLWVIFVVLVINFDIKARYEEKLLLLKFPLYADYMGNTSRFAAFIY